MCKKIKADEIFEMLIHGWGNDRDLYHCEHQEIIEFIKSGAKIIFINKKRKTGSFEHEVEFKEKRFIAFTNKSLG